MRDIVLTVDGNWILHRVFHTLVTSRPLEEALPYAFVGLVMKDACRVHASHVLVGLDGPDIFRYQVDSNYKANRSEKKKSSGSEVNIYQYLKPLRMLLNRAGIAFVQPPNHEADDVMASAPTAYPEANHVLASKDKDLYQVLDDRTKMFDSSVPDTSSTSRYMTANDVRTKKNGLNPEHMVMYQTLIGDSIDNIPSFMGPKRAAKLCTQYGSIKAWYDGAEQEERTWLIKNHVRLMTNRKLVELVRDLPLPPLKDLVIPKAEIKDMPNAWYTYQAFRWPKTQGLFSKR